MKSKFIIYICFILLAGAFKSIAQEPGKVRTASGVIKDSQGNPLGGVSISVQERTTEVVNAPDGTFSIEASGNDVLIFRKAGYNTVQKAVLELSNSNVILSKSLIEAGDDDNVFIPFGVRKKRNVSASISSIKGSELPQIPLSSLTNVLAGRLPGLYVQQTGSRPGTDDASLLVRGRSSYNSNQAPLILVDGVVRDFANMDLNEIESISVLKDAASLSWYGMTGANGVIYVTTKRGSATSTRVTFDAQGGVQSPEHIIKPLDAYTYATLYNRVLQSNGDNPRYDQAALQAYQSGSDPDLFPNNNFVDQFMKEVAPVQRYVATVSGGNAFSKYFTMLNYYNQGGLYNNANNPDYNANTNYKRYNFRTNFDIHVNRTLDVKLDVGGRVEQLRYPTAGNQSFLNTIYNTPANAFPLLNQDGTYGGNSLYRNNPLAMLNANGNITDLNRTMLATVQVRQQLKFLEGLSANVYYSYDITSAYRSGYSQNYEIFALNSSGRFDQFGTSTPLKYISSDFSGNIRNNEFWGGFDYDRTSGLHSFNFSTRAQRAVIARPASLDTRREGISNRLSYSYNQRYFLDLVASYSGSQNFAPGKRFGWFPAASAGWIISEESWFKPVEIFNYLKLRGSYGLVGNDGISPRLFAFNNYYSRSSGGYNFGTGFSNFSGTREGTLANPNLTWEKAKKASLGFDAKLFKQALSVAFDYFREDRDDLLTSDVLPTLIGQSLVQVNEGKARYTGFETGMSFLKTYNKLTVGFNANYTRSKSEVLNINESAGLPAYQSRRGFPMGAVIEFNSDSETNYKNLFLLSDGIFQTQAEIDAAPKQRFSGLVKPGDIRYKDINGDKVIDNLDYVMTSYSDIPKAYFGFGTTLKYSAFDLAVQFQGVEGRTIQIKNIINAGTLNTGYVNQFSTESWTPETAGSAKYPRMALIDRGNNTVDSDFWLRSGDYLRLKFAELGYTFSPRMLESVHVKNFRVYVSGLNLLTFSKLKGLPFDPEIPTSGYNSSYPYLRTFSAGVNLKF